MGFAMINITCAPTCAAFKFDEIFLPLYPFSRSKVLPVPDDCADAVARAPEAMFEKRLHIGPMCTV